MNRNQFIKKSMLSSIGMLLFNKISFVKPDHMKSNAIKSISPLGFPWKTQDPFLFCAYHRDEYPEGDKTMKVFPEALKGRVIGQDFTIKDGWRMYHGATVPGFPYHPHRGFETITINKEGVVDHSDSLGAAGRFMAGDVQWMTAGKGIQHSEMFPLLEDKKENPLEIFQVWLNLPSASKMVEPHFKMLWQEDIPEIKHKDSNNKTTTIQLIAGKIENTNALKPTPDSWAANTDNAVGVYTISMEPGAQWILNKTSKEANRSVFFYKGDNLVVEGKTVSANHLIELDAGEAITFQNGKETSYLLILEGKPIGEPVAQHGPFVMNTQQEIMEAMQDYQRTQFGGWPWEEREVIHGKEKGRFASHSDGRIEKK